MKPEQLTPKELEQLTPEELAYVIEASRHQASIGKMIGTVISKKSNDATFIQNLALALREDHEASLVFMLKDFSEQKWLDSGQGWLEKMSRGICIPDHPEEKAKKQTSNPAWLNILNALNQNEKTRPMIYERKDRLTLACTKSNDIFKWLIEHAPIIFTDRCILDIEKKLDQENERRLDMQMKIINALLRLAGNDVKLERIALEDYNPDMIKENIKVFIYAALERRLKEVQDESLTRERNPAQQDTEKTTKEARAREMPAAAAAAENHLSQIEGPKEEAEAALIEAEAALIEARKIYCYIKDCFDPNESRSEKKIINEIMAIRQSQNLKVLTLLESAEEEKKRNGRSDDNLYMLSIAVICGKYNIKELLESLILARRLNQDEANALPEIVSLLASQMGITLDQGVQKAINEFPKNTKKHTKKQTESLSTLRKNLKRPIAEWRAAKAAQAAATAASQAADAALRAEQTAEKAAQKAPAIAAKHSAAAAAQAAAKAAQAAQGAAQAAQAAQQEATRAYFLGIETRAVQVDAYKRGLTETPAEELNLLSCSVNPLYAVDPKTDPAKDSAADQKQTDPANVSAATCASC